MYFFRLIWLGTWIETILRVHDHLRIHAVEFQTAGLSDGESVLGEIDEHVVVAQNGRRHVDLGLESGSDWGFVDRRYPSLFDPRSGSFSAKRDRHAGDFHLQRRSGRAQLSVTRKSSNRQPPRHVKIGIPVVNPGKNTLSCSIRESKVNIDDDAVVAELEGNGDRLGLRLGREFGGVLREGGSAEHGAQNESELRPRLSHREIVANSSLPQSLLHFSDKHQSACGADPDRDR